MIGFNRQRLFNDLERRGISVASPLDKTRFDSGRFHRSADAAAAAVDHDRPHADGLHEVNVQQNEAQGINVVEDAAAEFDHSGLVTKFPDPS